MDWPKIIAIVKDLILAAAAITGSMVAVKGLSTWRRQLKGQAEYELAKRILKITFQYRDAINRVRHPMMLSYEMPYPPKDQAENMNEEQIRYFGTSKAYQARWDRVTKARETLYPELLESEALWGNDLENLFKVLYKLENKVYIIIEYHLKLINTDVPEYRKGPIRDFVKEDILYDTLTEEDNFRKELYSGIKAIENFLKPHLKY